MAQNEWFIMEIPWEIPMNMDDLGLTPHGLETSMYQIDQFV